MRSKQPRKQRRERRKAPLHKKQKFMRAPLSKDLRGKYGKRNVRVAKGDTVRVMRGEFAGEEAKVQSISLKDERINVDGVVVPKADGTEVAMSIHPSNVMITRLYLKDKVREEILKRK
jgi:large subunit ribosomal protein L24